MTTVNELQRQLQAKETELALLRQQVKLYEDSFAGIRSLVNMAEYTSQSRVQEALKPSTPVQSDWIVLPNKGSLHKVPDQLASINLLVLDPSYQPPDPQALIFHFRFLGNPRATSDVVMDKDDVRALKNFQHLVDLTGGESTWETIDPNVLLVTLVRDGKPVIVRIPPHHNVWVYPFTPEESN